ncbi:hypothetical protein OOK41_01800 [Micromonospora sp. NBC_01655]|uniref:hypothetical protein n=1 Tax=Micromonospora sp. NBC_01655 TaxID=2975983 RepID=UPI00224E15FE|nr:hypothetical protein [Micromonospora sp. NBC_01655]MCX4469058.1 hypothetical protein [Micromonospora sp. NBC_01655]
MSEPVKKAAQQAEERLDRVATSVREQFNKIIESRFADRIKEGRFADQVDHGVDQGRADTRRDQQGARRGGRGRSPA